MKDNVCVCFLGDGLPGYFRDQGYPNGEVRQGAEGKCDECYLFDEGMKAARKGACDGFLCRCQSLLRLALFIWK